LINIGDRVEIPPHYDLWMQGARFGVVKSIQGSAATVRMDNENVKALQRFFTKDLKRV